MADAFQMSKDRHARLRLDPRDQTLAAARHDHVDCAVEAREHHPHGGTIATRHQRDRSLGQRGRLHSFDQCGMNCLIRSVAFRAAAQDRRIACLEA